MTEVPGGGNGGGERRRRRRRRRYLVSAGIIRYMSFLLLQSWLWKGGRKEGREERRKRGRENKGKTGE